MEKEIKEYKSMGLNTILHFGKHKDQTIKEVLDEDPSYVEWMADSNFNLNEDVYEALDDYLQDNMDDLGVGLLDFYDDD